MSTFKTGICQLALIPMRNEPSQTSEQVSQVLFGETFDINEENGLWYYISLHFDGSKGWIRKKMASLIDGDLPQSCLYVKDALARIVLSGNQPEFIYIPGGSTLHPSDTGFTAPGFFYTLDPVCALHNTNSPVEITETALKFLHAPYLWGGRTLFGIDCSGFTQIAFKMNGIAIPRDAWQQSEIGEPVQFAENTKIGDLAFFDNEEGKIIHTGILIGKSRIIHASGKVRIDRFDHQGIFNEEDNAYSHKLRLIKRIIP